MAAAQAMAMQRHAENVLTQSCAPSAHSVSPSREILGDQMPLVPQVAKAGTVDTEVAPLDGVLGKAVNR